MAFERIKQKYTFITRKRGMNVEQKRTMQREATRRYRDKNNSPEQRAARKKQSLDNYYANREKYLSLQKERRKNNPGRELQRSRDYYAKNKKAVNKQRVELRVLQLARDPFFRKQETIRNKIRAYFRYNGFSKDKTTKEIIGASFEVVKKYLEKQFNPGMTWENHGVKNSEWHVDHVIPLSSAKTEEELIALFHYTNLQPLWGIENRIKSNKILGNKLKIAI